MSRMHVWVGGVQGVSPMHWWMKGLKGLLPMHRWVRTVTHALVGKDCHSCTGGYGL